MCIILWDKEKQYFKMKLNDIPEGDTHAYSCAHPHAHKSPHTHTIHCFENDSL